MDQLVHVGCEDREIRPDWRWSGSVSKKNGEARCAQVRILPILVFGLFAFSPVKADALEPVRPGQAGAIIRAVFVDKTLWTLSDAGEIFRITEAKHELVKVPTEDPALDLWIKGEFQWGAGDDPDDAARHGGRRQHDQTSRC